MEADEPAIIRCNNCMRLFAHEDDLELGVDGSGFLHGCPDCKTDEYLMDLDTVEMKDGE